MTSLKAVAHPLRHKWVLYYDASNTTNNNNNNAAAAAAGDDDAAVTAAAAGGNEWDDALRDVCAFDTVEDFWR